MISVFFLGLPVCYPHTDPGSQGRQHHLCDAPLPMQAKQRGDETGTFRTQPSLTVTHIHSCPSDLRLRSRFLPVGHLDVEEPWHLPLQHKPNKSMTSSVDICTVLQTSWFTQSVCVCCSAHLHFAHLCCSASPWVFLGFLGGNCVPH